MQHIPTRLDHENEFIAGATALDFANTVGGSRERPTHDHVSRYADLVEFARQAGLVADDHATRLLSRARTDPMAALGVLERAIHLRDAIWATFPIGSAGSRPQELGVISKEAAVAASHQRLDREGDDYHWSWSEDDCLDRVLWPIARSAAEILTSEVNRSAVHECESETCSWLFLDRTRNHSRRWCDMGDCGNRAKAKRFRQRRSAAAGVSRTP